jgi:glutaredoxin
MTASPEIVVYTQPHCSSCNQVEKFLDEEGFNFTSLDVSEDPVALEEITSRGYMSTPIIRIDDTWIAGFNRKKLKKALSAGD